MAEYTTTHFALPSPTSAGEVKNGATNIKELAEKADTVIYERSLNLVAHAGSLTAAVGELVNATANITVTAPALSTGAQFGVSTNGVSTAKLKPGAGLFYGDFVVGASELTLLPNQHVTFVCDGTNWLITAGEPKREQVPSGKTFTKAEGEAGIVLNATRPVLACVYLLTAGRIGVATSVVTFESGSDIPWTFIVNPGQKLETSQAGGVSVSPL